jgi:hypothetical protein
VVFVLKLPVLLQIPDRLCGFALHLFIKSEDESVQCFQGQLQDVGVVGDEHGGALRVEVYLCSL